MTEEPEPPLASPKLVVFWAGCCVLNVIVELIRGRHSPASVVFGYSVAAVVWFAFAYVERWRRRAEVRGDTPGAVFGPRWAWPIDKFDDLLMLLLVAVPLLLPVGMLIGFLLHGRDP